MSGPVGRCRRSPSPPGFCLRAPCPAPQGAAALAVLLTHLPLLPCGVRSTLSAPSLSGFDGCSARTAPAPSCAPPFSLRSTRTFRWNCRRRTAADAERTNAREGLRDSARRPSWQDVDGGADGGACWHAGIQVSLLVQPRAAASENERTRLLSADADGGGVCRRPGVVGGAPLPCAGAGEAVIPMFHADGRRCREERKKRGERHFSRIKFCHLKN